MLKRRLLPALIVSLVLVVGLGGRYMTYTWVVENIFAPTPSRIIQIL